MKKISRSKPLGIILAIFVSLFAYIYSWKEDYWKFWIGLVAIIMLFISYPELVQYNLYIGLGVCILIVIDFSTKKESDFYIWETDWD